MRVHKGELLQGSPMMLVKFQDAPKRAVCGDVYQLCGQKYHFRAEYIRRLADFNAACGRHQLVLRAGLQGAAAEEDRRQLWDASVACHAAWDRYRKHVAAHGCKRGVIRMQTAAA